MSAYGGQTSNHISSLWQRRPTADCRKATGAEGVADPEVSVAHGVVLVAVELRRRHAAAALQHRSYVVEAEHVAAAARDADHRHVVAG
jgi:hypothetical protein